MTELKTSTLDELIVINTDEIETIFNGIDLCKQTDGSINFNITGCWNSICRDIIKGTFTDTSAQNTLANIMNNASGNLHPVPDFFIVPGDNYYKMDDITPLEEAIDTGFRCFTRFFDVPYYMCFGNHDVEKMDSIKYQIDKTYKDTTFNRETNSVTFGSKWILPSSYYQYKHIVGGTSVSFLFIDTSILVAETYFKKTQEADKLVLRSKIQKDYKLKMIKWLKEKLEKNDDIKIVMGHHPIFAVGHKYEKKARTEPELFDVYKLMIANKAHMYLCADEHNSQYLYDDMNDIHHLVCGGSGPGSGGDITYLHKTPKTSFHTLNNLISVNIDGEMPHKVQSIATVSGPSFTNININPENIEVKIIGLQGLLKFDNSHIDQKCLDDHVINFDNYVSQLYYHKIIPKDHDVIYIADCDKYKDLSGYLDTFDTSYDNESNAEVRKNIAKDLKINKKLYSAATIYTHIQEAGGSKKSDQIEYAVVLMIKSIKEIDDIISKYDYRPFIQAHLTLCYLKNTTDIKFLATRLSSLSSIPIKFDGIHTDERFAALKAVDEEGFSKVREVIGNENILKNPESGFHLTLFYQKSKKINFEKALQDINSKLSLPITTEANSVIIYRRENKKNKWESIYVVPLI